MSDAPEPIPVVLGRGARFEGLVSFLGAARIEGELTGEVRASGTLIVGADADVEARIEVDELIVEGRVAGELRARRRIELREGARVTGSLDTPLLAAAEGCLIEGPCHAGKAPQAAGEGSAPAESAARSA